MKRRGFGRMRLALMTAAALASTLAGCGPSTPPGEGGNDTDTPGHEEIVTLYPDAAPLPGETECKVVIRTGIAVTSARHVPTCTPVQYATNPPSGGDHWGVWAAYKSYETEVPREIYVHSLEHGAIVLAYRCPPSGCAEVKAFLEKVRDGATSDPRCLVSPGGPEARLVVTPDRALDTPVAAAAWGATYTATCLDAPSLSRFVADHYAAGPEDTCSLSDAVDVDDPTGSAPSCGETPDHDASAATGNDAPGSGPAGP